MINPELSDPVYHVLKENVGAAKQFTNLMLAIYDEEVLGEELHYNIVRADDELGAALNRIEYQHGD